MKILKKLILILFVGFWTIQAFGQDMFIDGLIDSKWTCDKTIDDFNIGTINNIGISKLKVPVDSIKIDLNVWTFTNDEIWIQRYEKGKGLSKSIVKCTYEYSAEKKELKIFHFSQDSTVWEYSIAMISAESYVLMTKK